jgi:hypothetical protein
MIYPPLYEVFLVLNVFDASRKNPFVFGKTAHQNLTGLNFKKIAKKLKKALDKRGNMQ